MSSYRVLVTYNLSPKGVEIFRNTPGIETVVDHEISAEGLAETLKDFDALVVRSRTKLTAELMEKTDRLKVVGRAGTGLDNIDVEAATKRGIAVMNTPGGNTVTGIPAFSGLLVGSLEEDHLQAATYLTPPFSRRYQVLLDAWMRFSVHGQPSNLEVSPA